MEAMKLRRSGWLLAAILLAVLWSGEVDAMRPAQLSIAERGAAAFVQQPTLEDRIRAGALRTADLIVTGHPRLWLRGEEDWDKDVAGTFAWRILHGEQMAPASPANDQAKWEYRYSHTGIDYGADYMFGSTYSTYRMHVIEPIVAGKAMEQEWNTLVPKSGQPWSSSLYEPQHTRDEYYADARAKLLWLVGPETIGHEGKWYVTLWGSVAYDWLFSATFSDGSPVLRPEDRSTIQQGLITHAERIKQDFADPAQDHLFRSNEISHYAYVIVGFALYEPSRVGDASYAQVNQKAAEYLANFDSDWVGKILPALEAQGGDGGWHGGLGKVGNSFDYFQASGTDVLPWHLAPYLLAFNTATGKLSDEFVYGSEVLRHGAEFQAHMLRPEGEAYQRVGGSSPEGGIRLSFVQPMFLYSRRRFSPDAQEQKIGELGAWLRSHASPELFVDGGSWDMMLQLILEDKWVDPRSPEQIGFPATRHFEKLGWVSMRSGFTSPDDLAALFVAQRYHWSESDAYAQNALILERKGLLLDGPAEPLLIAGQGQRRIVDFPTLAQGVETYQPGSIYDVGPGILASTTTSTYDYVYADATNAYDPATLSRFTRQLVYIKPDLFVLFDRVVTPSLGIERKWRVDPGAAPQDRGAGLVTVVNGGGALWMKRLLPTAAAVTLSAEEIAVVPNDPASETYFLHVLQAVDAGASASQVAADDAFLVEEGGWFHVQVAGHRVSFNADGGFRFDDGTVEPPTFEDVPLSHWANSYVERLYRAGYVAGCSTTPRRYCPGQSMTRAESAVFVERGIHGGGFLPEQPTSAVFTDVELTSWYAKWADGLWRDGYTAGCTAAPLQFCPLRPHTRAEAVVFFTRMIHGRDYQPPEPAQMYYDDVAQGQWYRKWVGAAHADGLTEGCEDPSNQGDRRFRPEQELTRAEAACMMARAKGLTP